MIRKRRFSLTWLLLAPAVLMIWLCAFHSAWLNQGILMPAILSGALLSFSTCGWWTAVATTRRQGAISLIIAAALAVGWGIIGNARARQPDVDHVVTWDGVSRQVIHLLLLPGGLTAAVGLLSEWKREWAGWRVGG
jgi:hypothetical protein